MNSRQLKEFHKRFFMRIFLETECHVPITWMFYAFPLFFSVLRICSTSYWFYVLEARVLCILIPLFQVSFVLKTDIVNKNLCSIFRGERAVHITLCKEKGL